VPTGPVVVSLTANVPPLTGLAGVPCATVIGAVCVVSPPLSGQLTVTGSMSFVVRATGPADTLLGSIPAIFIPTTVGVERFPCGPVTVQLETTCTGTTAGNVLQGATLTVRFPLLFGRTADVPGTVTSLVLQGTATSTPIVTSTPTGTLTPTATATPEPPQITVTASCTLRDDGTFVITNTGGPMVSNGTWLLTVNGNAVASNTFRLQAGSRLTINSTGIVGHIVVTASGDGIPSPVSAATDCVPPTATAAPPATSTATATSTETATPTRTTTATATGTPTRTVTLTPTATPTSLNLYVGQGDGVTHLRTSGGTTSQVGGQIPLANGAGQVAFNGANRLLFVSECVGNLVAINTTSDTVAGTPLTGAPCPGPLAVRPDGLRVYLGTVTDHRIRVLSGDATQALAVVTLANPLPAANALAASADGTRVYAVDGQGHLIVCTIQPGPTELTCPIVVTVPPGFAGAAQAVAAGRVNGQALVLVANTGLTSTLTVHDPSSGALLNTIALPAGSLPAAVAISPDGARVYVTETGAPARLAVIAGTAILNPAASAQQVPLPAGAAEPVAVAVSSDSRLVYVADSGSSQVYVVDATALTVSQSVGVPNSSGTLAIAP
jgi:YVTN family beta-propeller protein